MFFILLWVKILPSSLHVGLRKKTVHECLAAKYCRYHNSCFDRISIHSPGCLKLKVALLQLASDGFHVCTTLSGCCLLPNTQDVDHATHIIYASKVGIEVLLKTSFWTHMVNPKRFPSGATAAHFWPLLWLSTQRWEKSGRLEKGSANDRSRARKSLLLELFL